MTSDEDFRILMRKLYQYIRAHHHLRNTNTADNQGPPSLNRITQTLETLIKAAAPAQTAEWMVFGIAHNWLHNSLQILETHYTDAIENWSLNQGSEPNSLERGMGNSCENS